MVAQLPCLGLSCFEKRFSKRCRFDFFFLIIFWRLACERRRSLSFLAKFFLTTLKNLHAFHSITLEIHLAHQNPHHSSLPHNSITITGISGNTKEKKKKSPSYWNYNIEEKKKKSSKCQSSWKKNSILY